MRKENQLKKSVVFVLRVPMLFCVVALCYLMCSCGKPVLQTPSRQVNAVKGSEFYGKAASLAGLKRDSFAVAELLAGNLPSYLKKLVPVSLSGFDSSSGKRVEVVIYVTPDYLSVGSNDDWARLCLSAPAAQTVANQFQCFLPTRKMVDVIYAAAEVKLEPVPMFAFRDSTPTMFHHHLIIEGQRKGRKGLIAGIKKDVVISQKLLNTSSPKVAIFGWHRLNGQPIQPLYAGHAAAYADYSHGTRLVHQKMKVNGKWMEYEQVFQHPFYKKILCDEAPCEVLRYPAFSFSK